MKILVPVDGSQFSMAALDVALDYAKSKGANICLINVMPYIEAVDLEISAHEREKVIQSMEKRAEYVVQQACGILAGKDVIATCRHIVASSSIPDAIIDFAESDKVDLIIIGSKGLSQSSRFKMGSVAAKVVKHSPCSVYVVKI
jgi:nucleotide-binding universal stress UspA family protein